MRRLGILVTIAAVALVAGSGLAFGVSSPEYDPAQQGCSPTADANDAGQPGAQQTANPEPGCHNTELNVGDSNGRRYVHAGILQERTGDNAHAADFGVSASGSRDSDTAGGAVDTNYQPFTPDSCALFDLAFFAVGLVTGDGCTITPQLPDDSFGSGTALAPPDSSNRPGPGALDLLTGAHVYMGSDDNLDTGEHDGVDSKHGTAQAANGPSDGGATFVNWHPLEIIDWIAAVSNIMNDPGAVFSNPIPVLDAGAGACADGICAAAGTRKQTAYQGRSQNDGSERNIYNYDGKQFDPASCSSGNAADEDPDTNCGGTSMNDWRQRDAHNVTTEPGVQVYEDPDPQASPLFDDMYPIPAAYVGTCGVVLGGGPLTAPASPLTNSAGQLVFTPTGC